MRTVLLTGMPRSGTTLACAMLNEKPDTVALVEPMALVPHGNQTRALGEVEYFVAQTRENLLSSGAAPSKHIGGRIPENTVVQPPKPGLLRRAAEEHGELQFGKSLTPDFCLVIKHPAFFTAIAAPLVARYPFYAIVRDPLAVFASWQTVDMPVNRGRMPMAEASDATLAAHLATTDGVLARQVIILEWLLTIYATLPDCVLRYEDIVADPTRHLATIIGRPVVATPVRQPFAPQSRYPGVDLAPLASALRRLVPLATLFYPHFAASLDQIA